MATRVAQHYAQVVGEQQQDGTLHVNRIYADVLISSVNVDSILVESANNVLAMVSTGAGLVDTQKPINTITLTHNAVATREFTVGASNTLNMVSLGGRVSSGEVTSNLNLFHITAFFNLVDDRKPAGDILNLIQTVTTLSSLEVDHDLGLIQNVDIVFPIKPNLVSTMGLTQFTSTPHRAFLTDTMLLADFLVTPLAPQSITQNLDLIQDSPIGRVFDPITFTQQVSFGFSQHITQNLGVTDLLHLQGIWVRSVEHANILGHAFTWLEDTPCGRKQYTPFQGENTIINTVAPPSNVLQDPQGDTQNFSVYQPYLGVPLTKVEMRKPELDNRDRNAYTRINQETRGGKLIVYADPDWPKVRTLAVTVVGLTETKVDELHTFMQATVGEEIGLTDWEGRLWKGFITNPNEAATQDGRDMWTVTFEFQGEMLEVEQPGNDDGNGMAMNISHSVSAVIV
jgi:hypothetical protein